MRGRRIVAAAMGSAGALVLAAAACTSFGGEPGDALAPDGGTDAAVPESGAPEAADDGSDSASADADTRRWCERQSGLLFCDDFDQGALGEAWDLPHKVMGGTLALESIQPASAPNALAATISAESSPAATPQAALRKAFALHPRRMRYAVDARIDQRDDAGAPAQLVYFGIEAAGLYYEVGLAVRTGDVAFNQDTNADGGIADNTQAIARQLPDGVWTRIGIDLTLVPDAGSPTVTVTLDGTEVLSTFVAPPITDGSANISAGVWFANPPTSGWKISFDNVAFSAE